MRTWAQLIFFNTEQHVWRTAALPVKAAPVNTLVSLRHQDYDQRTTDTYQRLSSRHVDARRARVLLWQVAERNTKGGLGASCTCRVTNSSLFTDQVNSIFYCKHRIRRVRIVSLSNSNKVKTPRCWETPEDTNICLWSARTCTRLHQSLPSSADSTANTDTAFALEQTKHSTTRRLVVW